MKKLLMIICLLTFLGCSKDENYTSSLSGASTSCGSHNGRTLIKGPKGGCYYNNSNGNKTYVDRSYCKC